jgi:hypothetical protein
MLTRSTETPGSPAAPAVPRLLEVEVAAGSEQQQQDEDDEDLAQGVWDGFNAAVDATYTSHIRNIHVTHSSHTREHSKRQHGAALQCDDCVVHGNGDLQEWRKEHDGSDDGDAEEAAAELEAETGSEDLGQHAERVERLHIDTQHQSTHRQATRMDL